MGLRERGECYQELVKICGEYGTLPSSYIIPESKVQKVGYTPTSSDWSGVCEGVYEDKSIAIRVIRRHKPEDVQDIRVVKYLNLFCSPKLSLVFCRAFADRSQPGSLYLTLIYWN